MAIRRFGWFIPVLFSLFVLPIVLGQEQGRSVTPKFRPRRVIPPQPAITKFPLKTADEVGDKLNPTDLVIGIEIDGEARAYPINMLTGPRREIINDRIGDQPFAATW